MSKIYLTLITINTFTKKVNKFFKLFEHENLNHKLNIISCDRLHDARISRDKVECQNNSSLFIVIIFIF